MNNERIKALAEEATRRYDRLGFEIPFAQPDLEEFAKLVANACAELCTASYYTMDGYGITGADARCAALIKKTFGVGE